MMKGITIARLKITVRLKIKIITIIMMKGITIKLEICNSLNQKMMDNNFITKLQEKIVDKESLGSRTRVAWNFGKTML